MKRQGLCLLFVGLLLGQAGCSHVTPKPLADYSRFSLLPPPPSEDIRSQFGNIGVAFGHFPPKFDINNGPVKGAGQGAGQGAAVGAILPLAIVAQGGGGSPQGFAVAVGAAIALVPVGAVVGAIAGAIKAQPRAKVEKWEAAVGNFVADQRIRQLLGDRIAAAGRNQTSHAFTVLLDRGPTAVDQRATYYPLAERGLQSVLEVVVERVELHGQGVIDPAMWLEIAVTARVVRVADDAELHSCSLAYRGQWAHTLAAWVEKPERLQKEFEGAYATLAEKIVEEVFLLALFPAQEESLVRRVPVRPER